jgi:hypothetical protein
MDSTSRNRIPTPVHHGRGQQCLCSRPNLSGRCPRKLRRVTAPQLVHDVEASVAEQSKCPGLLASRKLIRAECSAKRPACSKADDCFRRVSPAAFKNVVEHRRTKCIYFPLFQGRNCFLNVLARDLRPEVLVHHFLTNFTQTPGSPSVPIKFPERSLIEPPIRR